MVSGSGKKLFSVWDWIRILCSGCFGIVSRSPRPLSSPSLLSSLDLGRGSAAQEEGKTPNPAHHPHPHPPPRIPCLAWKFGDEPHVGNVLDHDDAIVGDNDGMFHGLFYLGSKVLTEVEMQSPVEDSKIIATPRRSNNSSRASSTRELDFGSSQVCLVDSASCSSSDAIAVMSPRHLSPSSCVNTSFPCCKTGTCLSSLLEQMDHILPVSSSEGTSAKPDSKSVVLYKHVSRHFKPDDDTAGPPSCRESNRNLDEEIVQPSFERSQRVGSSSPECRTGNPACGQLENASALRCRAGVSEGLQAEMPTGSLPDRIKVRGRQKDNDGGWRRARSLTDEDFNELRGCIDLGFVFTQNHIPDLCEMLPALEVCYAITPVGNMEDPKSVVSPGSPPISPWKIASPGDQPQQVKTRLRHWAQAVACNLRQAR